jgi:hypothetical protein
MSQFAREFNKSRCTILRWINTGFIFTLGYDVKRDVTGHWYLRQSVRSVRPDFKV